MKDETSRWLVMIVIQKNKKNPLTENVAIDHMGNSVKLNELKYIENLVKMLVHRRRLEDDSA